MVFPLEYFFHQFSIMSPYDVLFVFFIVFQMVYVTTMVINLEINMNSKLVHL